MDGYPCRIRDLRDASLATLPGQNRQGRERRFGGLEGKCGIQRGPRAAVNVGDGHEMRFLPELAVGMPRQPTPADVRQQW